MLQKFALWILILSLVHRTKTANYEVNVTRLLDPSKGDRYFISSATCNEYKCSDFGGAKSGISDCICGCPSTNATFSKFNGMLGCYKHVPDSEECKLQFLSQRSTSRVKTLKRHNFEVISLRACQLVYVRYFGNNGTWTDINSSQLSSFNLLHGRRGQTVSTALEIKSTLSKTLDGAIIKLGTTCSCLVFKLEGTRVCKIPEVKTKDVETTTTTMTTTIMSRTEVKTTTTTGREVLDRTEGKEVIKQNGGKSGGGKETEKGSGGTKEKEIQSGNKDGTTTTDLIVIAACAAAATIGVSIFCVLLCNMKRRRDREAKAHQENLNTNAGRTSITDQRHMTREQHRSADNVSICRSQASTALPVSDIHDLQEPQTFPVILVPASATNTYPNQRQFYLTQDSRALSVQSLNSNTADRYRRQRRDTSPLIRYKNVPQVPDTRPYQCMNERYVVLSGDANAVHPSMDRLQNPRGERVRTAPPKLNLVKPYMKQGTDSIPLSNISSPLRSSAETPPLDRSTKPKTLGRTQRSPEAARSRHENSTKSSNKKANAFQRSSSEDDLPPIDRSKKPKNSSTFPTYAKVKGRKKQSVRCQTAPSISTKEDQDYDKLDVGEYDLTQSDALFNTTDEKLSQSNELESPYDTDSDHDYDIPEGDVWTAEIHEMGQTTGAVNDQQDKDEDDIILIPLESESCIEETETRKPVLIKEPDSDETKSKLPVAKPPRKQAFKEDAPIAENRVPSLDSGFNSLGRIDEDNDLENEGIPDTQSTHK